MKIAICGAGAIGLEAALSFDNLGASVTLFSEYQPGGSLKRLSEHNLDYKLGSNAEGVTTELGRQVSRFNLLSSEISSACYFTQYLSPIIDFLEQRQIVKLGKVERVQKRFLSLDEEIPNTSRLHDLFRVVYSIDPAAMMESLEQNSPEVLKSMDEATKISLGERYELYEDFDIVIDARGPYHRPLPMGPSSTFALNEKKNQNKNDLIYGIKCFEHLDQIRNAKNLVIVGNDNLITDLLISLGTEFFLDEKKSVAVIGSASVRNQESSLNGFDGDLFFKSIDREYYEECSTFEKKLRDWRDLPDYMKAKINRPREPEKRITNYQGYTVTSLDRLADREHLYLTIEQAEFRKAETQAPIIKTIPCDLVCILNGHDFDFDFYKGIRFNISEGRLETLSSAGDHPEPGIYTLSLPLGKKSATTYLEEALINIEQIKNKILAYFERV